jgi:26S proteasome regulatory subunit T5
MRPQEYICISTKINGGIKESNMKIKQNKQLPWLVSNIVEVLDLEPEEQE